MGWHLFYKFCNLWTRKSVSVAGIYTALSLKVLLIIDLASSTIVSLTGVRTIKKECVNLVMCTTIKLIGYVLERKKKNQEE